MKVLLFLDDNRALVKILGKDLSLYYDVKSFWEAKDALKFIEDNAANIDVILCDYKMPYYNGIQVLSKAKEVNAQIARILLTGYIDEISDEEAKNEVYDRLVDKNVCKDTKDLIEVIEKVLKEKTKKK